jgi:hypothetical protein
VEPAALFLFRSNACYGFLSPLKIHRPQPGLNPRTFVPVASTLTITTEDDSSVSESLAVKVTALFCTILLVSAKCRCTVVYLPVESNVITQTHRHANLAIRTQFDSPCNPQGAGYCRYCSASGYLPGLPRNAYHCKSDSPLVRSVSGKVT